MSAVAPSRDEQAEITRFGIFDEDVLSEMEEHADDHVPCEIAGCVAVGTFRLVRPCCNKSVTCCTRHTTLALVLVAGMLKDGDVECDYCGHVYPKGAPVTELLRPVTL